MSKIKMNTFSSIYDNFPFALMYVWYIEGKRMYVKIETRMEKKYRN